jgi:hypothetical protein
MPLDSIGDAEHRAVQALLGRPQRGDSGTVRLEAVAETLRRAGIAADLPTVGPVLRDRWHRVR